MKRIHILVLAITILFCCNLVSAQRGDISDEVKEAMAKLSILNGKWQGQGWMMSAKREKKNSYVSEILTWKLDNTVLLIEGVGKDDSGNVVHNALATVFYDAKEKQYRMHSHLSDGVWTDALFEVIEDNKNFKWTIESHGASIVYSIGIEDGKWSEKGTYSRESMDEPMTFFEMNLEKK